MTRIDISTSYKSFYYFCRTTISDLKAPKDLSCFGSVQFDVPKKTMIEMNGACYRYLEDLFLQIVGSSIPVKANFTLDATGTSHFNNLFC
jgi:hypothetical protein